MSRFSHLAMIRKMINATLPRMARFLDVSESCYEKAETGERNLPLAAMIKLHGLSAALDAAVKKNGLPPAMVSGKETVMPNFRRDLERRLRTIRRDIARYEFSLKFIFQNWDAGTKQLHFLQDLRSMIPPEDPGLAELNSSIAILESSLVQYSPERQQCLQIIIESLKEQERGIVGILDDGL